PFEREVVSACSEELVPDGLEGRSPRVGSLTESRASTGCRMATERWTNARHPGPDRVLSPSDAGEPQLRSCKLLGDGEPPRRRGSGKSQKALVRSASTSVVYLKEDFLSCLPNPAVLAGP